MAWDLGSGSYHHASEAGGSGSRLRPRQRDLLNIGRQRDANRLKELTGDAGGGGAQQEALAILLELDLLQPVEIAPDVAPFSGNPLAAATPWRRRRSSSSLASSSARKEQNTWPRIAMSLLW